MASERGKGRGLGKEYPHFLRIHFLRISRGSARETKGWYQRAKFLLPSELILERTKILDEIIAMLTSSISTSENKGKN